ncbi:alpha/beta fold hydrolase [Psychrobium sp. 1_MG-2023]|uniref:alpha/beta fold hydrolase n=1 Tax=Psychrobium sp. 1_MG-2023 TaxID=3062624 RepID=UPI000C3266B2|nr:alpha/beta hydrolase [Psychrobium sp. 1_MG-2023]MDP2561090.1 alpha/beta hydrolase [Psychrobium sp. 1_MG-2023]PKF58379.1 hypothetical protein CW748_04250 [Alteromonadales bacterium alter-6D02]
MPESEKTTLCQTTQIPYVQFNQGSQPCLFIHANGYPSPCYSPLLQQLKGCNVWAPLLRPCWDDSDPSDANQWPRLVSDLVSFARARYQETQQPLVAISHSMGCIILLRAALREPQLFSKVVFIDPIFMPSHLVEISRIMPQRLKRKLKLVKKTLSRPDRWSSLQQAFDFHRPKRAFTALSDPALWQYIIGGTQQVDGKWQLIYPKAWEAWFYQNLPRAWRLLRRLELPTLGIKAENSEFLTNAAWQKWQKIQPNDTFVEFQDQYHLLPLEAPNDVAHAILDFIE